MKPLFQTRGKKLNKEQLDDGIKPYQAYTEKLIAEYNRRCEEYDGDAFPHVGFRRDASKFTPLPITA